MNKLILNICVGESGDRLQKAAKVSGVSGISWWWEEGEGARAWPWEEGRGEWVGRGKGGGGLLLFLVHECIHIHVHMRTHRLYTHTLFVYAHTACIRTSMTT